MARIHAIAPRGSEVTTFPEFEYIHCCAKDIECEGSYNVQGRFKVTKITVKGREAKPSQRFWDSLCSRFGFGPSIYNYFTPEEVFKRVTEKLRDSQQSGKDEIMVTIQLTDPMHQYPEGEKFTPTLLACSSPTKNSLDDATFKNILIHTPSARVEYTDGIFLTRHELKHDLGFDIGKDRFEAGITLETPIDGYGSPSIYLTLVRQVCSNGAVAMSPVFKSGITIGKKDAAESIVSRALQSFNNEDGLFAMRDRLKASQTSQASVAEAYKLAKIIGKFNDSDFNSEFLTNTEGYDATQSKENEVRHTARNSILQLLSERTGDIRSIYGIASINTLSEKRMRALPTKCSVYDLINLSTELATHALAPDAGRKLHSFYGDMIATEYDLEASGKEFTTFDDFVTSAAKYARRAS